MIDSDLLPQGRVNLEDDRYDGRPKPGAGSVPTPPLPGSAGQPQDPRLGQPGTTRPADYYSQEPVKTADKKGCGKWAIGCGGAGCLVVILLIGGFWWLLDSGWFGKTLMTELSNTVAESTELDEAAKAELTRELDEVRVRIERKEIGFMDLQGLLPVLQDAVADERIDSEEAEKLLIELRKLNDEPIEQSF